VVRAAVRPLRADEDVVDHAEPDTDLVKRLGRAAVEEVEEQPEHRRLREGARRRVVGGTGGVSASNPNAIRVPPGPAQFVSTYMVSARTMAAMALP